MADCKEDRMPVILEQDEQEVEIMKNDDVLIKKNDDALKQTDDYIRPLIMDR